MSYKYHFDINLTKQEIIISDGGFVVKIILFGPMLSTNESSNDARRRLRRRHIDQIRAGKVFNYDPRPAGPLAARAAPRGACGGGERVPILFFVLMLSRRNRRRTIHL
ncbi:hypothetical protein EVAR_77264_1 [Eumeta japonica]|uniref:Uncharacterized protein n=1 Tax=Eumeta variegata TaxID=151549 RepID=A0A4C1UM47_EUMVA|nr:hypothetical protein EVAR_77264_1 [Eumeta japonica]